MKNKKELKVAIKNDANKVRVELLPYDALMVIAKVLTFGAKKYDDHNWSSNGGFKWSRLYGAMQRHAFKWWHGHDKDDETNLTELAHLGCCLLFLISHELRKLGIDDRPKLEKFVRDEMGDMTFLNILDEKNESDK